MPPLNFFCCGCPLRAGAITAAVITAIQSTIFLIAGAATLAMWTSATNDINKSNVNEEKYDQAKLAVDIICAIIIICGIVGFVIFACLLMAIKKNSPGLLIPWLVCSMIDNVLLAISCISGLALGNYASLVLLIDISFFVYLWIVVFSYHKELSQGSGVGVGGGTPGYVIKT